MTNASALSEKKPPLTRRILTPFILVKRLLENQFLIEYINFRQLSHEIIFHCMQIPHLLFGKVCVEQ